MEGPLYGRKGGGIGTAIQQVDSARVFLTAGVAAAVDGAAAEGVHVMLGGHHTPPTDHHDLVAVAHDVVKHALS